MTIIGTLPNIISNGQNIDAGPLMNDLNYIVNQVNTNVPLSTVNGAIYASMAITQALGDNTTLIATDQFVQNAIANGVTATVGSVRNFVMNVASASSTATATADEIVVESTLGGVAFKIGSFNNTINLSITGVGGMDTGTAPISGYVSLYAIYNPTTLASGLLACNVTTSSGSIYSGANMPSGYTMSALVSTWITNSSGQFVQGQQIDRLLTFSARQALNTTSTSVSITSLSLSSVVPPNAKLISGDIRVQNATSTGGNFSCQISSTSPPTGQHLLAGYIGSGSSGFTCSSQFTNLLLPTSQTMYYSISVSGGLTAMTTNIYIAGYTI